VTFTWDFGDGSPAVVTTNATTSHAFANAGAHTVTLAASNGYGVRVTASSPVFVWRGRLFLPVAIR